MFPVVIIVGIIILVVIVLVRSAYQKSVEDNVIERLEKLKHAAATRRFITPDSENIDDNQEYCNVFHESDSQSYRLTQFSAVGIQEELDGLTEAEVNAYIATGQWQLTGERYTANKDGKGHTMQFERQKKG